MASLAAAVDVWSLLLRADRGCGMACLAATVDLWALATLLLARALGDRACGMASLPTAVEVWLLRPAFGVFE